MKKKDTVVGWFFAVCVTASGCSDGSESDLRSVSDTSSIAQAAPPPASSMGEIERRRDMIKSYFRSRRASWDIRATTATEDGRVYDWIVPGSQLPDGKLAPAPPAPQMRLPSNPSRSVLEIELGSRGPTGTVPILRMDSDAILENTFPSSTLEAYVSKFGRTRRAHEEGVPLSDSTEAALLGPSDYLHKYAQAVEMIATDNAYGTDGYIYVPSPYVYRNDEFSLGQVSFSRGTGSLLQTVEVGWQKWQENYGDLAPHFFVYFTTNGYTSFGNYVGGYNTDVLGWVQSSSTLTPGAALTVGSELYVYVRNFSGNWWVWVNGQWIGYYPGTLYATTGLRNWGNRVSWYGEILDYIPDGTASYTYMGNGTFAGPGSAYTRNLRWENTAGSTFNMNASFSASHPGCYSVSGLNNSPTTWQTYFYWGGPGKYSATCL